MRSGTVMRSVVLAVGGVLAFSALVGGYDRSAFAGNGVALCHIDGGGRIHAINVNANAVTFHMGHGDYAQITFYLDADGDGYGDGTTAVACTSPGAGYVTTPGDCDDVDAAVNPGAFDACGDHVDNDCDGAVDQHLFARLQMDCNGGSEILTLCGPGPHDITSVGLVSKQVSYLDLSENTSGARLTQCGSTSASVAVTGDKSLCEASLAAYNDNVCIIELF